MKLKHSLITRIFIAGLLASIAYFSAITLLSYFFVEQQVHQLYLEKAGTISRSLDAEILKRADLSSEKIPDIIQQNILLDPDILSITIYTKKHGVLVSSASNLTDRIGHQAGADSNRAFFDDKVITRFMIINNMPGLKVFTPVHLSGSIIGSIEIELILNSFNQLKTEFLIYVVTGFILINALVLFVFIFYMNTRVAKPANKLLDHVHKISRGDFDVMVPINSKDELGLLSEDFNKMAISLNRQRKEILHANKNIEYQATHDMLTGLPNRYSFHERIRQSLVFSKRHQRCAALMMLDLDQFKPINDSLGHHAGDELLKQVASRLSKLIREEDMLARLGGDEFVILISEVSNNEETAISQVQVIVDSIIEGFHRVFVLDSQEVRITSSIGIVFYPQGDEDLDEILKNADTAMYKAKEDGGNCSRLFEPKMQKKMDGKVDILKSLDSDVKLSDMQVLYQPQVDSAGKLISAEALVRWLHPRKGLIHPRDFITVVENEGLILELGDWVLASVCEQVKSWRHKFPEHSLVPVSINISSKQFHQKDFCDHVIKTLESYDIPPSNITLEITESALLENFEASKMKMQRLKKIGLHFSIDNFGSGFSSLTYLQQLPLNEIKIDRAFVRDMMTDSNDGNLVNAIINVSIALELNVVAEGVENQMQFDFLIENHCKLFQGFLFDQPLSAEQFEKYL